MTDDLATDVPRYENGYLYPTHGPGLGVTLNDEALRKFAIREKRVVISGRG
jgi:L-alanine-DL-glutamate epimerase-like enolase superfamily enzyme